MKALIEKYLEAKNVEALATAARVELGELIASKLEHPDEGQQTHTIDEYKVSVKGVVNRKVDWEEFNSVALANPGKSPPCRTKQELDLVGLKWCRDNEPLYYLSLCSAITATPGRTSIEIKKEETK